MLKPNMLKKSLLKKNVRMVVWSATALVLVAECVFFVVALERGIRLHF